MSVSNPSWRGGGVLVLALCASLPGPLEAQNCSTVSNIWEYVTQCGRSLTGGQATTVSAALEGAYGRLRDPATLNSALGKAEGVVPGGLLVHALDLHFVTVQEGENQGLGLKYDWAKSIVRTPHSQGKTHWGFDLKAASSGLITVDADDNPEELLESSAYPHLFWSWGGAVDSAAAAGDLAMIQDSIFAYQGFDRDVSPQLEGLLAKFWDGLSTELYLTAGPEVRFESDQAFSQRQWAIGGKLGVDLKVWNPANPLAKLNVFDWPAAVFRSLTGADNGIHPRGSSFPTVLLFVHQVAATANPTRESLVGLDPYTRWGVAVNYRSLMAQAVDGAVWLEMSYHHYAEVYPPTALRELGESSGPGEEPVAISDLYASDRFKVGVFGPGGLGFWWATGRLPLDTRDEDSVGMGFRMRF